MANEFDVISKDGYGKPKEWKCRQCDEIITSKNKTRNHVCRHQVVSASSYQPETNTPTSTSTPMNTNPSPFPSPFLQTLQRPPTNLLSGYAFTPDGPPPNFGPIGSSQFNQRRTMEQCQNEQEQRFQMEKEKW